MPTPDSKKKAKKSTASPMGFFQPPADFTITGQLTPPAPVDKRRREVPKEFQPYHYNFSTFTTKLIKQAKTMGYRIEGRGKKELSREFVAVHQSDNEHEFSVSVGKHKNERPHVNFRFNDEKSIPDVVKLIGDNLPSFNTHQIDITLNADENHPFVIKLKEEVEKYKQKNPGKPEIKVTCNPPKASAERSNTQQSSPTRS